MGAVSPPETAMTSTAGFAGTASFISSFVDLIPHHQYIRTDFVTVKKKDKGQTRLDAILPTSEIVKLYQKASGAQVPSKTKMKRVDKKARTDSGPVEAAAHVKHKGKNMPEDTEVREALKKKLHARVDEIKAVNQLKSKKRKAKEILDKAEKLSGGKHMKMAAKSVEEETPMSLADVSNLKLAERAAGKPAKETGEPNLPGTKNRRLKELRKEMGEREKLEAAMDEETRASLDNQRRMEAAMARAGGQTVVDLEKQVGRLQKSQDSAKRNKVKSQKKWAERVSKVKKDQEDRQIERKENIKKYRTAEGKLQAAAELRVVRKAGTLAKAAKEKEIKAEQKLERKARKKAAKEKGNSNGKKQKKKMAKDW